VSPGGTSPAALLLVGCGKMGGALLRGWLERGIAERYVIVEPGAGAAEFRGRPGVTLLKDAIELSLDFRPAVVVFAVKPQAMEGVAPHYVRFADGQTLFLSIAAGKPIAWFEERLGAAAPIVRAMPNTPASIARGMSVACPNAKASPAQIALCDRLLGAVGEIAWVDDEALLDPVTALSGGGPAYVFLLIETLAQAGVRAGLPEELAMRLARSTVAGAGELARLSAEPASVLRQNVTSPGGTTLAALEVLMRPNGLQALFDEAIAAATRRSRELAR
jgi:pyrroline-5-carboxylate reductase